MKVYNYMLMIVGMLLLLDFAGIPVEINLLSSLGIGTNFFSFGTSPFWNFIFGTTGKLIIIAGAAIIIGTLARSQVENYLVLAIMVGVIIAFVGAFKSVIDYTLTIGGWVSAITILLLAPLAVGFAKKH
jgi:hypothetical protein